ncbi:alanine racemase [Agrobacterium vitis]|uniref:alanine racemase n=1 Tax=Agrobacterium vitis TaxID=373 RepID=UPI001571CD62|nr:alanine racemase [Agrobacterium vitis]NSZ20020.1 alanine racemase [Agrobacterium vitis]QZO07524.1 alanine racemase [Agrobacterium vitis]UJL90718.1 alanine racemase [Agrobacterium vitis]
MMTEKQVPDTQPHEPGLRSRFLGFERLDQPRVVVDMPTLRNNITHMAAIVGGKAALHPHVKTHKSLGIACLQRQAGATGFTAATPHEALMLLRAGFAPVTLAYPLVSLATATTLIEATDAPSDIRFIADSSETIDVLSRAAVCCGSRVSVFLKVDVGLHRCGVDPHDSGAVALALAIERDPRLDFAGLLSHAGHAYGAGDPAAIRAIAGDELDLLRALRQKLHMSGIAVPKISVGSTPTLLANAGFDDIDEVRPGNYVFYDLTAVRLGIARRADIALAVAARIVSVNSRYAIANVGSKLLSSDLGAHGTSATNSFGEAWMQDRTAPLVVAKLSEEHAFLIHDGNCPAIGTPVLILPNHSCPVANLSGGLLALGGEGEPPYTLATEGVLRWSDAAAAP